MQRKEFCEKDGILITYNDENVCFEEEKTAKAILIKNDGTVIHSNFDEERTEYFKKYFNQIYNSVMTLRNLDAVESA